MLPDKPFQFDQDEWKAVEVGVHKCLHFLKLKFTNNSYTPSENFTKDILVRPEYEEFYVGLRYFLALIGDWNSFLILLDNAPKKCPAISPENVVMFVKWKTYELDTVFSDVNGNAVCDRFGNLVTPQRGWSNYNKVPGLLEAIEELHKVYFLTGPYDDMCKDCFKIYQSSQNHGCDDHFKEPKPFRRGNPIESIAVSSSLQFFQDIPKRRKGGSDTLTPFDLLKLRTKLLESKSILHSQAWIIVLLSVKLFLRIEEVVFNSGTSKPSGITIDSFDPSLTVYKDGKVEALGLVVNYYGKKSTLMVWADHVCPKLCPILHLQSYLYCGFLFPSLAELHHPPADGHFVTVLKAGDMVDTIVHTIRQFRPEFEFGLQTFVKSGYMLATWGGASLEKIMKSARHTNKGLAIQCQGDSEIQLTLVNHQGLCVDRIVARWTPILIEQGAAARALIDVRYDRTLFESSVEYIERICKVQPTSIYFDMKYCIDKCIAAAEKPSVLKSLIDKTPMSEDDKAKFMAELEKYVAHRVDESMNSRIAILEKEVEVRKQIMDGSFSPGGKKRQRTNSMGINNSPTPEEYNYNLEEALEKERKELSKSRSPAQERIAVAGEKVSAPGVHSPRSSALVHSRQSPQLDKVLPSISSFDGAPRSPKNEDHPATYRPPNYHSPQISHLSSPRSVPSTTPRMQYAGANSFTPNRGSPLVMPLDPHSPHSRSPSISSSTFELHSPHIRGSPLSSPLEVHSPKNRGSPLTAYLDHPSPQSRMPPLTKPLEHHSPKLASPHSIYREHSSPRPQSVLSPRLHENQSPALSFARSSPQLQHLPSSPNIHQSPRPRYASSGAYSDGHYDIGSPRSVPSTTPRLSTLQLPGIKNLPYSDHEQQRDTDSSAADRHLQNNRSQQRQNYVNHSNSSPRPAPVHPRHEVQSVTLQSPPINTGSQKLSPGAVDGSNLPTPLSSPYMNHQQLSSQYQTSKPRPPPVINTRVYSPSLSNAGSDINYGARSPMSTASTPVTPSLSTFSDYYEEDAPTPNGEAKKKRKFGEIDLEGRSAISDKQLSDVEKLECILQLYKEMPKEMRDLTCGARNFVNRTLNPVINCLKNHFNGNKHDFILTWRSTNKRNKELVYSRFNEKCKGSTDICPSQLPPEAKKEKDSEADRDDSALEDEMEVETVPTPNAPSTLSESHLPPAAYSVHGEVQG
ncbi:hypothetical protein HDV06_005465 [Boothiomyces sp. JEL0866]|nr:hypothetical protein HDV06_005465 [Boothiomyces sp. JEL0866]